MRIDAHAHALQESWVGQGYWQGLARIGEALLGVPAEVIRDGVVPAYFDHDGSSQLGAMEEAGVDVAVMFPFDWTLEERLGPAAVGWREQNDWYAEVAARSEGRVRWAFGVDPRQRGALPAFEEAVRARGAVGLKLHPSAGFPVDDPAVYPFAEKAGELEVPVIVHVGPQIAPLYSRWSQPMLLDTVAADFPEVRFVAAHTGNLAWREALAVASVKPNVWCELSGWQRRFQVNPARFYDDVREVLEAVGHRRVMWGTDAPHYRALVTDPEWVRAFTDAPQGTFSEEEVDAILGGTAAEVFGL
ncbi:MAG: amidohydrolase family protein [Actinomycetota bacterium]